jgi:hypothetical protein
MLNEEQRVEECGRRGCTICAGATLVEIKPSFRTLRSLNWSLVNGRVKLR